MSNTWSASNEEILAGFDAQMSAIWHPRTQEMPEEGSERGQQYEALHNELALVGYTPIYDAVTGGIMFLDCNDLA
jgi:hypothetical protein